MPRSSFKSVLSQRDRLHEVWVTLRVPFARLPIVSSTRKAAADFRSPHDSLAIAVN
ncbi:hypothetical protein K9N68_11395 [Kovacikia minuta CCNUW1]|uniref:hypothetical protein n=1 Tax=Kovacikia minuta TaxID=2931930 RepID=UPI001CCF6F83|nr:hypothetical protein [Kovacikia minuta]UBF28417.1 hypothetical protein K9N68_11395 [Kovacikia minuta CCNUW1]